jgi:four helix bundle protein
VKDSFKSYRDLEVWQKSMGLAKEVYQVTSSFPADEKFGLTNQMRRAAVSIPSNLAEGHARSGTQEFKHFISIAIGSVAELETQILLSAELGYLNKNRKSDLLEQLDIIGKMLRGLYKSLNRKERM